MAKAMWNGKVVAESPVFEVVEGNVYFPAHTIRREFFKPSANKTMCHWKGTASYYTLNVDGKENVDAAWFYPTPKAEAARIKDHVAFWKGVEVSK